MSSRVNRVFDIEMKLGSRRWLPYAGRSLFVAMLLVGMASIWWSHHERA